MNTIPFAEIETVVANERHNDLKTLENKRSDFNAMETEITGENSNEFFLNTEHVKSALQPVNVFKPISRNDFGKWETDVLVDYIIKTHHDFTKKNAVIIYNLAQKVTYRHSDNHPELRTLTEVIFLFLHDLLNLMLKEERSIFPYIRQKEKNSKYAKINDNSSSPSLKEKIKLLQNEHRKAFTYLKVLRQVTNNFRIPYDACNSYNALFGKIKELEDDLSMHFHLENDILFPNAIAAYKCD
jgi:regulator of cell morphogenesis and NO signaling